MKHTHIRWLFTRIFYRHSRILTVLGFVGPVILFSPQHFSAAQDGQELEILIRNSTYEFQGGVPKPGQPVTLMIRNQDKIQHGFTSQIFQEPGIEVEAGGVVTFGNGIKGIHINPGETARLHFVPTRPGKFSFQCDLHPSMKGEVLVLTIGSARLLFPLRSCPLRRRRAERHTATDAWSRGGSSQIRHSLVLWGGASWPRRGRDLLLRHLGGRSERQVLFLRHVHRLRLQARRQVGRARTLALLRPLLCLRRAEGAIARPRSDRYAHRRRRAAMKRCSVCRRAILFSKFRVKKPASVRPTASPTPQCPASARMRR